MVVVVVVVVVMAVDRVALCRDGRALDDLVALLIIRSRLI
jgi:hypothetical protein